MRGQSPLVCPRLIYGIRRTVDRKQRNYGWTGDRRAVSATLTPAGRQVAAERIRGFIRGSPRNGAGLGGSLPFRGARMDGTLRL